MVSEEDLQELVSSICKNSDEAGLRELAGCVRVNLLERFRHLALTDTLFAIGWAQLAGLLHEIDKRP